MSANSQKSTSNPFPNCANSRGFKMALLNIASLPKHVEELRISKLFSNLDLFALNETRLDNTISDGLVNISGYDIVRKDRSRRGGGVCIYLRTSINYKIRNVWFLRVSKRSVWRFANQIVKVLLLHLFIAHQIPLLSSLLILKR